MSTDSDLLNRYLDSGDQAAFAELLSRHSGMVHAAARRLAPSDADDIAQAVFLLLLRKASTLRKQPNLVGWLYQTTLYCARNARRSQSRRDHHERQTPMPEPTTSADPAIRDLLDTALTKLTQTYRDVLLLRYLEGLSISESAQRLGISPEAVEKRAERALAKLRATLTTAGHDIPAASLTAFFATEAAHQAPSNLLPAILAPTAQATTLAQSASILYTAAKLKTAATLLLGTSIIAAGTVAAVQIAARAPQSATPAATQSSTHILSDEEAKAPGSPALYTYTVGVEEPVARELEKLASPLPGALAGYRLYRADAEKVRLLLRKEFIAGNVSGMHLSSGLDIRPVEAGQPVSYTGRSLDAYRTVHERRWGIDSTSRFAQTQLTRTASGLRLVGQLRTTQVSATDSNGQLSLRQLSDVAPTSIDAELYPGEVLLAVLDLGTVGASPRCHLILMHCTKVTPQQAAVLKGLNESEHWLRLGPSGARMLANFTDAYRDAARDQDHDPSAWTRTLSDGTTIRFVSLGLPSRWPLITWDPDGKPLPDSSGWQLPMTPGDHRRDSTSLDITVESPHPIGLAGQKQQGTDAAPRYVITLGALHMSDTVRSFAARVGVGPWQNAGRADKGVTIQAGDARVTISEIYPGRRTSVAYMMNSSSDCFTIVAITPDGKRIWPDHCTPALPWGDSDVRIVSGPSEQAMFLVPDGATIDHFEVLWRKAETVQFEGYAMEPRERPSFDLTRDYLLAPGAPPTRSTTTQPALAEKDLPTASMRELITAARSGDVPAVEKYLTGGTPEHRRLVAQMLTDMVVIPPAFKTKYGTSVQGHLAQVLHRMEAAFLDKDLVADGPDTFSSRQITFRRQFAGYWAIDITSMFPDPADTQVQRQADFLRQARQSIESQTYPTAAEAQKALDTLLPK